MVSDDVECNQNTPNMTKNGTLDNVYNPQYRLTVMNIYIVSSIKVFFLKQTKTTKRNTQNYK